MLVYTCHKCGSAHCKPCKDGNGGMVCMKCDHIQPLPYYGQGESGRFAQPGELDFPKSQPEHVYDLERGNIFTLPCEGNGRLYVFLQLVADDKGNIQNARIKEIAGYWAEGARGKNQPAQWVFMENGCEHNCNPYAGVKLLAIPAPG